MPSKTSREVSVSLVQRAQERMADPRSVWGIPWGFPGLDLLTGGIHEGEVTILAARPRVGKTTLMAQVADAVCTYLAGDEGKGKYPGHVIKLVMCESSAEVFQQRLLCYRARVSIRKVREGRLTPDQFDRYKQAARDFCTLPVRYLDDARSLDQIAAFLSSEHEPACWWALDYLQKIPSVGGRANDGGVGATNLISTTLTELGRRVAPGLVLSQLTREVDKREDKRPQLADLRGSGQIEADARLVLGLYREDVYLKIADEEHLKPRPAELRVLKQNEGDSDRTVDMMWHPSRAMYQDVSQLLRDDDEDALIEQGAGQQGGGA